MGSGCQMVAFAYLMRIIKLWDVWSFILRRRYVSGDESVRDSEGL